MNTQQTNALLALHVYDANLRNQLPPPPPWTQILPQPPGTDGFAYAVYRNTATNEIVISFRGTDNDLGDWTTNLGISLSQGKQAAAVYARILRDYGTDAQGNDLNNISFTGHSLGGGLAATMAVWFNRPAVVFDPAPSEVGAKYALDVIDVVGSLGTAAPQSIKDYWTNINGQFAARESNVTSYFAPGSIVFAGSTPGNTITGAGQDNPVQFGIANMGGVGGMIDMHSQALLTAGLLSDPFRAATVSVQNALPLVMSKQLYALPASGTERNFLIDLIRSEQQTPDNSKLDHFAADLNKLGTHIAGLTDAAQKALIAQGIEWYYWQGASANTTYTGQEFFTQSGTLLQYTTAQGAELQGAQNKVLPYVKAWLDGALGSVQNGTLLVATPDYTRFAQWNVNAGANGVSASALDPAKTQIFIGQGGAESFAGGNAADLLFGGAGDDTLIGNTGNDTLLGGSGVDTYQFSAAWGKDLIADSDGLAVVRDAARETFSARHPRPITSNSIAARGHRVGIEGLSGTKFRAFGARRRCWRWRLGRGELNTLLARPRRCPPHIGLRRHLTCVRGAGWPLESLACDLHGFRLTHDLCATPTLSAERDET